MIYKFFDKKFSKGSGINSVSNQQLADELHKAIVRKCKRKKVHLSFKEYLEVRSCWYAIIKQIQQRN